MLRRGFIKEHDSEPIISGFEFYFDALRELGSTRQFGMAPGPIPFTAIVEYFKIFDIDGDFEEFAYIIRRLDNAYLELNSEEAKPKKGSEKSGSNSNQKNHSKR